MFHNILGWVGGFLFAICAVPQVAKTWKNKKAGDLSWWFLGFWFFGEILMLTYIVYDDLIYKITHVPLYLNYGVNLLLVSYLLYAKKVY
jgi:uncharacterized protein with PQ loop repeat